MKSKEIYPEKFRIIDSGTPNYVKQIYEALSICESELELEISINQQLQKELKELKDKLLVLKFFNIKETCNLLGISSRTLQTLRDTKQIDFTQRGKKIFFLEEHINKFLGR